MLVLKLHLIASLEVVAEAPRVGASIEIKPLKDGVLCFYEAPRVGASIEIFDVAASL